MLFSLIFLFQYNTFIEKLHSIILWIGILIKALKSSLMVGWNLTHQRTQNLSLGLISTFLTTLQMAEWSGFIEQHIV